MQTAHWTETYVPTKGERRGAGIAHGAGLLVGAPLVLLLGAFVGVTPAFAYLPSPIVAYMIARSFRRRKKPFGAFQGMQAAVVHLAVGLLLLAANLMGPLSRPSSFLFMLAALLFLYSVWGAWDTILGEDFRYIGINKLLHRVSQANMKRQEQRRGLFRPYRTNKEQSDK